MLGAFPGLRNSLRLKLVLLIGLLAIASTVGFTMLTSRLVQTQMEQDRFKLQRLLAIRMASRMGLDMAARANELQFLASLDRLRDPSQSDSDKQAMLTAKQAAYPVYAWIGLTDASGRILASTEPRINGADVSQRTWFQRGRQDLHFEDIHDAVLLGKFLPRPQLDEIPLRLMDISLPLHDQQNRFIGVLAAHLSLDWTYDLQASMLAQVEEPALELLLVNRNGDIVVGNASLPASSTNLSALFVVREAQAGQVTTAVETWSDGRRYLAAAAPALGFDTFPGLGWTVVVRMDEAVAMADARGLVWPWPHSLSDWRARSPCHRSSGGPSGASCARWRG